MTRYTAKTHRGTVTLDGKELNFVTECDTKEGYVIQAVRDSRGMMVVENYEVKTARLTGKVEFKSDPKP